MKEELPSLGISTDVDTAVARLTAELRARALDLGESVIVDGYDALRERARLLGFHDPSNVSANGHSHVIQCIDGWIVLSLARLDDVDMLAVTSVRKFTSSRSTSEKSPHHLPNRW